eukprot:TRINITY_DN22813_c0_g1_i1.p3 TRINITY_DN22813_c0_g1~~TRINITY_DN22813_c0_g1_i1.p3  ORF type:complete len:105 (-),score=20.78 TRINITY_DN22813_c0_g1_i1:919-1233(-)
MFFFFFKQKTAYEIMPSLVGSEMCIRDRVSTQSTWAAKEDHTGDRNNQDGKEHQDSLDSIRHTDRTEPPGEGIGNDNEGAGEKRSMVIKTKHGFKEPAPGNKLG